MKIKSFVSKSLIVSSLFLLAVLVSSTVFAVGEPQGFGNSGDGNNPGKEGAPNSKRLLNPDGGDKPGLSSSSGKNGALDEKTGKPQNKLKDYKLKICKTKEKQIMTRAESLGKLATTTMLKFDAILARVKEYHEKNSALGGETPSNYDALTTDVTVKREAVRLAVEASKAAKESFSCEGDDPKAQMEAFRTSMQTVKTALQDYRTSIKNLIVAVRSVSGALEGEPAAPTEPTQGGND